MNLTKADVARLGRQRLQPVKAEGELLAIFVEGKLVNPLNASAWGWQKRSRIAKRWKEAVATALLEAGWTRGAPAAGSRAVDERLADVLHATWEAAGLGLYREMWIRLARAARDWLSINAPASARGSASDAPKVVTFLAHTGGRMDSDGLQAALKPVRDALVECGVLSGDADRDGHTFHYAQRIDRAQRGVVIRVRLA